jgi:hypothetical protein
VRAGVERVIYQAGIIACYECVCVCELDASQPASLPPRPLPHSAFLDSQEPKPTVPPSLSLSHDARALCHTQIEYIRRDAEGSDSDTRRRAAADLVKSLTERFPQEVTGLFTGYVKSMLDQYAANPAANWKAKDTAIYLVLALTVQVCLSVVFVVVGGRHARAHAHTHTCTGPAPVP